ncbi:RRXRR domain-containing protein [Thermosulfurimonas sp. F29]|uniref:RRXRR domain-containing protein n=1 Tax=Thermosulfurimonas sp. F29 TaxID=2867247 RepID=UPI001C83D24B|nr:RRXRR domain-containing protein [Thermosulfurimonas sp. F29]MBX6423433.1 HNH endonuclease [Thermosulfurimonas sp. F29]
MLIATKDKHGNPGHPTRKVDMVFRLVRRGRAKLIGGGFKPLCVQFLDREFDPAKTVPRRFTLVVWPGFKRVRYALFDGVDLIDRGILQARTPEIRKLIEERRMHRRRRRYLERKKRERKGLPRFNKVRRTVFEKGKRSPTVDHGVRTVLSLIGKIRKWWSLPWADLEPVLVDFRLDVRAITWGKPERPEDYQVSPRGKFKGESPKEYTRRVWGGRCAVCGRTEDVEIHHLRPRKQTGTDLPENLIPLCGACHRLVHHGLLPIPLKGMDQRALGVVNTVCGLLRKLELKAISAWKAVRRRPDDPLIGAFEAILGADIEPEEIPEKRLAQFRRHRRAVVHAVRDRLYRVDGKIVARNRNRRTDQKEPSWNEYRKKHPKHVGMVEVSLGVKLVRRIQTDVRGGNIYRANGVVFVARAAQHNGRSIYSPDLEKMTGKNYISIKRCKRLMYNEGITPIPLHPTCGLGGEFSAEMC